MRFPRTITPQGFRRYLPLTVVLGGLLALFALPVAPERLLSAIDLEPEAGWSVVEPLSSFIFAPFVDLARYFSTLADHPAAAFASWFFWIFLLLFLGNEFSRAALPGGRRERRLAGIPRQLRRAALIMIVLLAALTTIRWPAMKPVPPSADWLLADLHTHSMYSWDSMTSADRLLRFHEEYGFGAFVVTDHDTLEGARKVQALAASRGGPAVLLGSEIRGWPTAHYLFIGLQDEVDGKGFREQPQAAVAAARAQGAAVVLSKWWTKTNVDLKEALAYPIDGMEVYNLAYGLPSAEKGAYLAAASRRRRLPLYVASDWHGLGYFNNNWNAFFMPGWEELPEERLRSALLAKIRGRDLSTRPLLYARREYRGPLRTVFEPFFAIGYLVGGMRPGRFLATFLWVAGLSACWIAAGAAPRARRGRGVIANGALTAFGLFVATRSAVSLVEAHALKGFGQDGNGPYVLLGALGLFVAGQGVLQLLRSRSVMEVAGGGVLGCR